VGLVVFVVLVWFLVLSPIRGNISSTEASIEDQRSALSVAQTALAQAQATREEGQRNQARLLELAKMVPPAEELPSLLLQIQDLADQSGIDFIAISPGEPLAQQSNPGFQIIPLDLQFQGTFFDVSDFAYRAEQMVAGPGRLVAIKSLDLTLGQDASAGLGAAGVSPGLEVTIGMYGFVTASGNSGSGSSTPASSNGSTTTTSVTGATTAQ
jgi:Tfp pilus assembly protein PilO